MLSPHFGLCVCSLRGQLGVGSALSSVNATAWLPVAAEPLFVTLSVSVASRLSPPPPPPPPGPAQPGHLRLSTAGQVSKLDDRRLFTVARLAQLVEHETLNLRVVGSSPTLGVLLNLETAKIPEHFPALGFGPIPETHQRPCPTDGSSHRHFARGHSPDRGS